MVLKLITRLPHSRVINFPNICSDSIYGSDVGKKSPLVVNFIELFTTFFFIILCKKNFPLFFLHSH